MSQHPTCPSCGAALPPPALRATSALAASFGGAGERCAGAGPQRRQACRDLRLRRHRQRRARLDRRRRSTPSPASCSATPTAAPSRRSIVPTLATIHGSGTRYRIDGEIARGGMGSVLKGRDPDLGRDVALKVLREDLRDNADMVRRFVEEAQIGGQLQHPGIVPIYELGTFGDRRPFFRMKLVKGHTLAKLLADTADPGRRPAPVPVDLRVDRQTDRLCPRPRRDPSRPEAVERDGRHLRRGPGDGLGPGQGPAARRRRRRRPGRQDRPPAKR